MNVCCSYRTIDFSQGSVVEGKTYLSQNSSQNILDLIQLLGVSRTHKSNPTAQIINKPSFQKQERKPSEQKFNEKLKTLVLLLFMDGWPRTYWSLKTHY